MIPRLLILFFLLAIVCGCGPQMRMLPVGEDNLAVQTSIGGPMISVRGPAVPIPYAMAGATYGLTDHLNIHSDFHVTSAVFKFLGVTPGISWFPARSEARWQPSLSLTALAFSDFQETRIYPEVITTLANRESRQVIPFFGVVHTFQTDSKPEYLPSAFAGLAFPYKQSRFVFELQALALNFQRDKDAPDYLTLFDRRGALSLQIGYSLAFGGNDHD
ncbi:hypothetical protein KKG66_05500 [bacterium]|nr:hypothetical protein [bacterium]